MAIHIDQMQAFARGIEFDREPSVVAGNIGDGIGYKGGLVRPLLSVVEVAVKLTVRRQHRDNVEPSVVQGGRIHRVPSVNG